MRCTSTEVLRNFCPSYRHWTRYHITVCQVNIVTNIGWHKCLDFGKSRLQIPRWRSIILNLIAELSVNTSYYVTITSFLILAIYCMLQNAEWSYENSVHTNIPLMFWNASNSTTAQRSMQLVWCWITFLPKPEKCMFAKFALDLHLYTWISSSFSKLSDDRFKASSKTVPPHSAI